MDAMIKPVAWLPAIARNHLEAGSKSNTASGVKLHETDFPVFTQDQIDALILAEREVAARIIGTYASAVRDLEDELSVLRAELMQTKAANPDKKAGTLDVTR